MDSKRLNEMNEMNESRINPDMEARELIRLARQGLKLDEPGLIKRMHNLSAWALEHAIPALNQIDPSKPSMIHAIRIKALGALPQEGD